MTGSYITTSHTIREECSHCAENRRARNRRLVDAIEGGGAETRSASRPAGGGVLYPARPSHYNFRSVTIHPSPSRVHNGVFLPSANRSACVNCSQSVSAENLPLSTHPNRSRIAQAAASIEKSAGLPTDYQDTTISIVTGGGRFCGPDVAAYIVSKIVEFIAAFGASNKSFLEFASSNLKDGGPFDVKTHNGIPNVANSFCPAQCPNTLTFCDYCLPHDAPGNIAFGFLVNLFHDHINRELSPLPPLSETEMPNLIGYLVSPDHGPRSGLLKGLLSAAQAFATGNVPNTEEDAADREAYQVGRWARRTGRAIRPLANALLSLTSQPDKAPEPAKTGIVEALEWQVAGGLCNELFSLLDGKPSTSSPGSDSVLGLFPVSCTICPFPPSAFRMTRGFK